SPGEADVVELLRLYAERTGGAFPPKLDDWGHFAVMLTKGKGGQDLDEKGKALLFHVGRASPFLSELKSAGGFGYRPDAAKAGDPKTIIFWYRPNAKEKVRYRAIFADLRVADVTADQVPSDPATR